MKLGHFILLLFLLLHTISTVSFASHDKDFSWMGSCCGKRDCNTAIVSIVEFGQSITKVMVDGVLVELPSSAIKESQDGHTYWCALRVDEKLTSKNIRCVFYTIGS